MTIKSTRSVLGQLLVCLLVCLHRSLICLLCTPCFACALRCTHSLAPSLIHSLPSSWERGFCPWIECVYFIPTVHRNIFLYFAVGFLHLLLLFLAVAPKRIKSCRTQGESVLSFVRPYIRPSPPICLLHKP